MSWVDRLLLYGSLVAIIVLLASRRARDKLGGWLEPLIVGREEPPPEAGQAPSAPAETTLVPPAPVAGAAADFTDLAAALRALADGVRVPGLYSAYYAFSAAGETMLLPAESGVAFFVLSYAVTAATEVAVEFWSGTSARLWRLHLQPAAGRSGANLAGAWPMPVIAPTNRGEGLRLVADGACEVAITFWRG
jgi:hypothetical protein